MNKPTMIALAAVTAMGLGSAGIAIAAPDAPPPPPPAGQWQPGMMHRGMMHRGDGMHHRHPGMRPLFTPGTFALIYHPADRQLTPADAQKLAEGMLAWNGNHTWKVIDVKAAGDKEIDFSFAAADGTVIANFEVDRHTGQVRRIG